MAKKKRISFKGRVLRLLLVILISLPAINGVYQLIRKPSEIIGLFDSAFFKTPSETWRAYRDHFIEYSTEIITPTLLAAIAQKETNGNPIARTFWRFQYGAGIDKLYAPASTAVGMFQITDGTFKRFQNHCFKNGKAVSGKDLCPFNWAYSRLFPAHATEITAAYLHKTTLSILKRFKRHSISLRKKQELAALVHLCGNRVGTRYARLGFNQKKLGMCGSHNARRYIQAVSSLERKFRKLALLD